MKQSFYNNIPPSDLIPIMYPYYDIQTKTIAPNNIQFCNTLSSTNAPANTQNNLKRNNAQNPESHNDSIHNNQTSQYIQKKINK